jgi:hypothetical protein
MGKLSDAEVYSNQDSEQSQSESGVRQLKVEEIWILRITKKNSAVRLELFLHLRWALLPIMWPAGKRVN